MPRSADTNSRLFPDKESRYRCWESRDAYWACLDKKDSNASACQSFRKVYEEYCPSTWVKHFNRKREYDKFKKDQYEGVDIDAVFKNK